MPSWGSSPVQPSLLRPQASLHPADTSQEEAWCAALHSKRPLETTGPWGVRCAMPFSRLNHFSSRWSPFCYRIFLNPLFPSTTRAQPSLMSLGPGTTRPSCSCPPVPATFHVAVASGRPRPCSWEQNPSLLQGLADCFFQFRTLEMRTPIFLFLLTAALFGLGTLGKRDVVIQSRNDVGPNE